MQEPLTLYKLMILYTLDSANSPLRKSLVSDCLIDQDYTDYMTAQTAIGELKDGGFIESFSEGNAEWLRLTQEGSKTLSLFLGNLNEEIRRDCLAYLKKHNMELRNASSVYASYKRSAESQFEVTLTAKDRGVTLIDLRLNVPTEEIAKSVCENWQRKNADLYAYLTEQLF